MIQIMFARRLRFLLNDRTRVTCAGIHPNNYFRRVNLTVANYQTKHNLTNLRKNTLSPVYTFPSYSNLSVNEETDLDNDHNDALSNHKNRRVTENGYMYGQLLNSEKYSKTVMQLLNPDKYIPNDVVDEILAKKYEEFNVTELLDDFKTLSCHARLNSIKPVDELHSKLFELLAIYICDLTDDQLWDLMKYAELWFPMKLETKHKSFNILTNAIDNSLCLRMQDFSIDEILMSCDLTYHLRQARHSKFFDKAMKKIGSKPKKLSPSSYIHYMFMYCITRRTSINMYELEYALESIIDKFEADELGIISLAFFKTQTPIRNPALLDKIIKKCIVDMDKMGDISIAGVFKVARYSLGLNDTDAFRKLLRAFASRIPTCTAPCLVHAGHAAATILVHEKDILYEILDRFKMFIPSARLKDLERMLFILAIFNFPKELPHYELIINELRNPMRTAECQKFHRALSSSLMYLSWVGIYPLDIIQKVLSPDYLEEMYNSKAYQVGQEFLVFPIALEIEVRDYKGPTLPPRIRHHLSKKYSTNVINAESPNVRIQWHQKLMIEVMNYVKTITGPDAYVYQQLLPHSPRTDVVFCVDSENNFVPPQQYIPDLPVSAVKYAPKIPEGHQWLSLVFASYNHTFRGTANTCGTFNAKLRLLKKIGYTPIVLPYDTWKKLKSSDDKMTYVQNLILRKNM